MIRASSPGRARWSMPLMPHMSPAAIGCSVVMLRGWPEASKRRPMAASVASGQPRPEAADTVRTAPSGISAAASSTVMTLGNGMRQRPVSIATSRPVRAAASAASAKARERMPSSPVAAGGPRPATASSKARTPRR